MSDSFKIPGFNGASAVNAVVEAKLKRLQDQYNGPRAARIITSEDVKSKVPPKELAEMEKAAAQFEGLMMQQLMKSMWQTVPKDGLLSGSKEEEYYRDMLNENLADDIAKNQSVGIKDVIMRELISRYDPES